MQSEKIYQLCLEIEKLPASEQQTKVSVMASALFNETQDIERNTYLRYVKNVRGCARCGQDHPTLKVLPISNPIDDFNYWGFCPNTYQPVLVKVMEA